MSEYLTTQKLIMNELAMKWPMHPYVALALHQETQKMIAGTTPELYELIVLNHADLAGRLNGEPYNDAVDGAIEYYSMYS
jgi:hypothetical protein